MFDKGRQLFDMIVDDRGRVFSLMRDPRLRSLGDEVPDEVKRRVRCAMLRGYFGRFRWRLFALIAIVIMLVMLLLWINPFIVRAIGPARMAGWAGFVMPIIGGVLIWFTVAVALEFERFVARRRGMKLLTREGHCLRCLYLLRGILPKDDGCTVCPECGAAWRLTLDSSSSSPLGYHSTHEQ